MSRDLGRLFICFFSMNAFGIMANFFFFFFLCYLCCQRIVFFGTIAIFLFFYCAISVVNVFFVLFV